MGSDFYVSTNLLSGAPGGLTREEIAIIEESRQEKGVNREVADTAAAEEPA